MVRSFSSSVVLASSSAPLSPPRFRKYTRPARTVDVKAKTVPEGGLPRARRAGGFDVEGEKEREVAEEAVEERDEGESVSGEANPTTAVTAAHPEGHSYNFVLSTFESHRSVALLLGAYDTPHPQRVYRDLQQFNVDAAEAGRGAYFVSKKDKSLMLAHAHVMLRILADGQTLPGQDEYKIDEESTQQTGEFSMVSTAPVNHPLQNYFADTLSLWTEFTGGENARNTTQDVSTQMLDAVIRCCSVLGATEEAVRIYDNHKSVQQKHHSPRVLAALMWTFAEKGDVAKCIVLYNTMKKRIKVPSTDAFEALVHAANVANEAHTVLKTWQMLTELGVKPRQATYEMTVNGFLDSGFNHHAVLFYEQYQKAGGEPSAYLAKRMEMNYKAGIDANMAYGSKIANAVTRSPHLSYKMLIDFCRVKTTRDLMLPDHVPSLHTHFFAPVDGAGMGMGVSQKKILPLSAGMGANNNKVFTAKGKLFEFARKGHSNTAFSPPGNKTPYRTRKTLKAKRPTDGRTYDLLAGKHKNLEPLRHDWMGNRGHGMWCDERRAMRFPEQPL